jgi:hypothetical protein
MKVGLAFEGLAHLSSQPDASKLQLFTSVLKSLKEADELCFLLSKGADMISVSARACLSISQGVSISEDEPQGDQTAHAVALSAGSRAARHTLALGALQSRRQRSSLSALFDSQFDSQVQAVLQKFNVAAFCIACIFHDHQCQKLLLDYPDNNPISLFDDVRTLTTDEASKMYYEKAVLNGHEDLKGKPRLPALEDKEANIMQMFCVTQESDTLEYASLLTQTLICLSAYLHQRSYTEKSLHPHIGGVPHRYSQLFNRTWCRFAELKYEAPILRFALQQVMF